jgi:hypothetical protein
MEVLMSFLGLPVPFDQTFQRAADTLVNKVLDEVFNPNSDAARLTVVVIYNHSDTPIFLVDSNFDTGGFTPGMQAPFQIDGKTAAGYRVESHGFATGVTGAHIRYGANAGDPNSVVLDITSSNPFAGDNSSSAQGVNGFGAVRTDSTGNANQVDVDLFVSNQ